MPEPTETTIPHEFKITAARVNGAPVTFAVASSAGADGATVVFIDTGFEPDGSDGGPGLRIILNDHDVFEGVPYLPGPDDEAPLELNLDKVASMLVERGFPASVEMTGGNVATLITGDVAVFGDEATDVATEIRPWTADSHPDYGTATVAAGPGSFGWTSPSTCSREDVCVGFNETVCQLTADEQKALSTWGPFESEQCMVDAIVGQINASRRFLRARGYESCPLPTDVPTGDATFDTTDGGEVKAGLYVGDLRRMLAGVPDDTLVVVATDGWYQHVQSIVRPDASNEHVAFTLYPDFGPDGGFDPRDV